jgi:hypothetical protein
MNIMDGGGGDKGGGSNQQQSTSGYCKQDQQITANNYPGINKFDTCKMLI